MTRIAIFCDGTWNSSDIDETTSVYKLQNLLENDPTKGQVCAYFAGIGTDDRFDNGLQKFFNRWGGGVFGWGLDGKVKQAYQFLCHAYQPDDEIYLFGFSRGAYTARSVAGMIRKCGLIDNPTTERINEAFALYRKKGLTTVPINLILCLNANGCPHGLRLRRKTWRRGVAATLSKSHTWVCLIRSAHVGCRHQSLARLRRRETANTNSMTWPCLAWLKVHDMLWQLMSGVCFMCPPSGTT